MGAVVPGLFCGVIGGAISGLFLITVVAYASPRSYCPHCSAPQPRISPPRTLKQALYGGRVCRHCGKTIIAHPRRTM